MGCGSGVKSGFSISHRGQGRPGEEARRASDGQGDVGKNAPCRMGSQQRQRGGACEKHRGAAGRPGGEGSAKGAGHRAGLVMPGEQQVGVLSGWLDTQVWVSGGKSVPDPCRQRNARS